MLFNLFRFSPILGGCISLVAGLILQPISYADSPWDVHFEKDVVGLFGLEENLNIAKQKVQDTQTEIQKNELDTQNELKKIQEDQDELKKMSSKLSKALKRIGLKRTSEKELELKERIATSKDHVKALKKNNQLLHAKLKIQTAEMEKSNKTMKKATEVFLRKITKDTSWGSVIRPFRHHSKVPRTGKLRVNIFSLYIKDRPDRKDILKILLEHGKGVVGTREGAEEEWKNKYVSWIKQVNASNQFPFEMPYHQRDLKARNVGSIVPSIALSKSAAGHSQKCEVDRSQRIDRFMAIQSWMENAESITNIAAEEDVQFVDDFVQTLRSKAQQRKAQQRRGH